MNNASQFPINPKFLIAGGFAFLLFMITILTIGINDNGQRTVVQWPSGTTFVKFSPGMYVALFGSITEYSDVITTDLDHTNATVRYQDGGTGYVEGTVRAILPTDEVGMLKLHRSFRGEQGLRSKLLDPEIQQALNLTAGLMTSEEAYNSKRGQYREWGMAQLQKGTYKTVMAPKTIIVEGIEVQKDVSQILKIDGVAQHNSSPFNDYGMVISQFQLTEWGFEEATLRQISDKRNAEMAVITAKANTTRAKEEALQSAAEGEKAVTIAKFDEEKKNQPMIAAAAKDLEVAKLTVIKEQENAKAAKFYKIAVDTRTSADAGRKKQLMEADGALEQKLKAYVTVQGKFAEEFGKQKWVPDMQFGATSGSTTGSAASDMIDLLTVKAARDLNFDPRPTE